VRAPRRIRLVRAAPLLVAGALLLAVSASAAPDRGRTTTLAPLSTGFADPWVLSGPAVATRPYADAQKLGARFARIYAAWSQVAPTEPAAPRNPGDPAYHWQLLDTQVQHAVAHGLTPIVNVFNRPAWAGAPPPPGSDSVPPDPDKLGAFAEAAARHYDGGTKSIPRVRFWEVWNEPNLGLYLKPQRVGGKPFSPAWYRAMVVAFAAGVKGVDPANLVVAGGLTPFQQRGGIAPLQFIRELFCLNDDLTKACSAKVPVDVWGIHPYTWGGPLHKAPARDDLSLGNLPELERTLAAAVRSGNLTGRAYVSTWATEFCWASDPPVKGGVPSAVLTRWVAEALYRMWANGVTNVIWFQLYDRPAAEQYHCGLYTLAKRRKPAAAAFRFPFVAYPGARTAVWGRTPTSTGGTVTIEVRSGASWRAAATVTADAHGMFSAKLALPGWTEARARFGTQRSPAFAATAPAEPKITSLF
jgi:hypothetical protein